MVKKKGGRELNPVDAFRKSQRAKEVSKNKKERHIQREAFSNTSDPSALREQLKEILDAEEAGNMNPTLRLKKKALQQAYHEAIKKQMAHESAAKAGAPSAPLPATLSGPSQAAAAHALPPLPGHPPNAVFQPPLPPLPPPPPGGPQAGAWEHPGAPAFLPPPPGAPRRTRTGLGHGAGQAAHALEARHGGVGPPGPAEYGAPVQPAVISAESTVVPLPKAHHDKNLTSMVPPALARRATQKPALKAPARQPGAKQGFGLVPSVGSGGPEAKGPAKQPAVEKAATDASYDAFMESMRELGAL